MRSKHFTLSTLATLATLATVPAAHAAEPFSYLDRFNEIGYLNADLWMENEVTRLVLNKQLYLGLGTAGSNLTDTGYRAASQFLSVAHPDPITAMAADVTVDFVQAPACDSSKVVSSTMLRMGGSFFNVGTATPKSMVGDVVGWITVARDSLSAAAEGQMTLVGSVAQCKTANCSSYTVLGSVDLGTANRGTKDKLILSHDAAAKTFMFQRNLGGTKQYLSYTVNNSGAPGVADKRFTVANKAANCSSADPRLTTKMVTRIDNVQVNESAVY